MFPFSVQTFKGLEELCAMELEDMGAQQVKPANRAVTFMGDDALVYRANLELRTGLRVLQPILTFRFASQDEYYRKLYEFDWTRWFKRTQSFVIDGSVRSRVFSNSNFAKLKLKDAVVDCFRDRVGKRPDVDTEDADIHIFVLVQENTCRLYINTSGEPLFKRGYREPGHPATLNENIAAALVYLSGWDGRSTLLDLFCGSGTILVEAAEMQARKAAGLDRTFSFINHKFFDREIWKAMVEGAHEEVTSVAKPTIFGSDHSHRFIDIAKQQTRNAGLDSIRYKVADFREVMPPTPTGTIISNLPYGERLQENDDLELLYHELGKHLKSHFKGWTAWFLSSDLKLLKKLGMSPSERHTLMNGSLEVRFQKYEIY